MSEGGLYRAISFKSTFGFPQHCPDFQTNSSNSTDQLQADYYTCLNDNAQKFKMDLDAYLDSAQQFCCFVQESLKCETETLEKCDKNFATLNTMKTESLLNYSCSANWPAQDCEKLYANFSKDIWPYIIGGIGVLIAACSSVYCCYRNSWLCFRQAKDYFQVDKKLGPVRSSLRTSGQQQLSKGSKISQIEKNHLREEIETLETKRTQLDDDPEAAIAAMKADPDRWCPIVKALEANDVDRVREVLSHQIRRQQKLYEIYEQKPSMQEHLDSVRKKLEELETKWMELDDPDPAMAMADMKANAHDWDPIAKALKDNDAKGVGEELSRLLQGAQILEESSAAAAADTNQGQGEKMQVHFTTTTTASSDEFDWTSPATYKRFETIDDLSAI